MPLVKKRIFLTAGATSDQVLAGSTYEYVDANTVIRVAAAVDTAGTSATADTTMNFTVNNVCNPACFSIFVLFKIVNAV